MWCFHIIVVSKEHNSDAMMTIKRVENIVFDAIVCYGYQKAATLCTLFVNLTIENI